MDKIKAKLKKIKNLLKAIEPSSQDSRKIVFTPHPEDKMHAVSLRFFGCKLAELDVPEFSREYEGVAHLIFNTWSAQIDIDSTIKSMTNIDPINMKCFLQQQIKDEKEALILYFLSISCINEIENYYNGYKFPSYDDIVSKALTLYKKQLLEVALHQFETDRLIKTYSLYENMYVEHADRDLSLFICDTDKSLLENDDYLGKGEFSDKFKTKLLPTDKVSQNNNKTTLAEFFSSNEGGDSVFDVLRQQVQEVEELTKIINEFASYEDVPETEYGDKVEYPLSAPSTEIKTLRDLVRQYENKLNIIAQNETQRYENRDQALLQKREEELRLLKGNLERASELTDDLKDKIKEHIDNMKGCEPTFWELSLMRQILDILTLGLASCVYGFFNPSPAEKDKLYDYDLKIDASRH
jgi:hypothetical protein